MARVIILVGHTGSGKSEIALNLAVLEAKQGKKVTLVDLDIVNPYFCIRDHKDTLFKSFGINVVSSNNSLRNAELMVVPKEVTSYLLDSSFTVIIDVGGDSEGAKVLKQYDNYLKAIDYECYFVVNPYRANTTGLPDIINYINEIKSSSSINITHLINNSNLLSETTKDHILNGTLILNELSNEINIPIKYTVINDALFSKEEIMSYTNMFIIKSYINTI